ncbi:Cellobiose dehydrogenase (acceptor) [Ascochyta rabiei]|uniref:Flavin adenine dinucleotide binding n=1 Tax=Didymella rabiei TaxID=5454 RepID=A0A162VA20_DIDRA|nr:Cellobiose dehydrogenase (acceptor) [Ascochyta rabiei]KZM18319.1 flavin adenine dinucleotide binding [Ascochyta rabiei]UPX16395.1 Cellobiose dehydrogenase (acceptor) [Ascochyta rabiei]
MKVSQTWTALLSTALVAIAAPIAENCTLEADYDVIVVGSGPAGIIVADRMSEAGKKTLLLEQGGPSYYVTGGRERPDWLNGTELSRVDVPGLYKSIFSVTGNLTCASDVVNAFQGCTVGGNTAINAGLFFQPPASDWDLYFPTGWKNSDMQSAIAKVHAKQPSTDNPSADGKRYLQSGYHVAKEWLVEGAGYADVGLNDGWENHQKTKVFGHPIYNYEGGQRSGPAKTYLQSALQRPNFHFQTGTKVIRVIRDGQTATGVEIQIKGSNATSIVNMAKSGRVVLSGGALLSPQLLMWSGIGEAATLGNLSASGQLTLPASQWINNSAVGDKVFDNPNTFIELFSDSISSYNYNYTDPIPADRELYLKSRSGPYSFGSQTSAFWDFIKQGNETIGCQGTIDSSGAVQFMENGTITLNVYGTSGLRSFGRVGLDAKGVATPSSGFFYSDKRDAQAVGQFIYNLFQALPVNLKPLNIDGNSTLEEITTWVSSPSDYTLGNVQHWSSSCRFETCVDANAKVIGTNNIHVVDASISAPLTTNPVLGTMIIAERAVEKILALSS